MTSIITPIHPDGWRFVGLFALLTLILFWAFQPLGWIGLILTGWCVYFFRQPKRVVPLRPGLIISPADGKVVNIESVIPPAEFDIGKKPRSRISIFLNVFDVHVNSIPAEGTIIKTIYHPGRFFNASLDKASEHNERQSLVLKMATGHSLAFVQIAGLIARRIRCDVKQGDQVGTGDYFGLIRFGSRVDVYLPENIDPLVLVGQRMIAGETILGDVLAGKVK